MTEILVSKEDFQNATIKALALSAAVQRVRELHQEINGYCAYCADIGSCCNPKDFEYPCPTIKALEGER